MTLTPQALSAIYAQDADQTFLMLAEFSQEDWSAPLVNNNEPITHQGKLYTPALIKIAMPDQRAGAASPPSFTVSRVNPVIIAGMRQVTGPVDVTITRIVASDPDTAIQGPYTMSLANIVYDRETIRGTLIFDLIDQRPLSYRTFDPQNFPGLFS